MKDILALLVTIKLTSWFIAAGEGAIALAGAIKSVTAAVMAFVAANPIAAGSALAITTGYWFGKEARSYIDKRRWDKTASELQSQDMARQAVGADNLTMDFVARRYGLQKAQTPSFTDRLLAPFQSVSKKTATLTTPTETSTKNKGKSAAELLVENIRAQIKYLYADGESFIPILDQWIARSQTLGKDWRALKDLKQEIVDTAAERNPFSPENMLESMKETQSRMAALREESAKLRQAEYDNYAWQNDAGLMSDGEYLNKVAANFERLKAEFASTGAAAENFLLWPEELRNAFSTLQSAILQNAEPAIETLKKQLDEGKLSVDEYKRAAQELVNTLTTQGLSQGNTETLLKQLTNDAESAKRQIIDLNELTKTWVEDFQSGIANAIVEGEGFADTLTGIGKEMEKVALKLILFGKNGQGGLFGSLFSGIFGGFHSGGIVGGSPTFRRMVRIPKFHSGGIVGRDERLIIAQRGEGVFTREQMKALGGGGGSQVFAPNVSVTVNNSGGGDMSDEQAQQLGQAVNEQIRIKVAEELYKYQRAGVFRNAFAR